MYFTKLLQAPFAKFIKNIFQDHPNHDIPMLGGMWSMATVRDRNVASYLFKLITNNYIATYYNPKLRNKKGFDQFLLSRFFSYYSLRNSTTHDSFRCQSLNGDAWPSQRRLFNCFVGCVKVNCLVVKFTTVKVENLIFCPLN